MLKDKYKVEDIPITPEFRREKRVIEPRGELVLLTDGEEIRHITYFSLNPGNKFFRGGHYHKVKTEKFYIVSGKVKILLKDVESGEEDIVEVEAGQRVTISPLCTHRFFALSPAQVIEYYACAYDSDDDIKYEEPCGD